MKEDRLALAKAVESGDTDLGMYTGLCGLSLNRNFLQSTMFFYIFRNGCPLALSSG